MMSHQALWKHYFGGGLYVLGSCYSAWSTSRIKGNYQSIHFEKL